jgi:hypothetical protein
MNIDLGSLKKLESLPASATSRLASDDACLLVLVKLRSGAACPDYVALRGGISECMFSAEVTAGTLVRLEADDAVESVAVSKVLPGVA